MDAEPFFASNDGSVMALEHALRFPVLALGSRAAAVMRGAAYLSGVGDAVVVSVGASSAAVGILVNGYPRETDVPPEVEGIRMDFRAPSVAEIPVGAGGQEFVTALQGAIARMWGAHAALPLVVVGEGSDLVPEEVSGRQRGDAAGGGGRGLRDRHDRRAGERPGGRHLRRSRRPSGGALEAARSLAIGRAVVAGADPRRVDVVEIAELPLSDLLDPAIRVRVRASGPRM